MATEKTKLMVEKPSDKQPAKPGLIIKTEKLGRTISKPININKPK
ncbi:hypothetical protein [Pedobacter sp. UYP1]